MKELYRKFCLAYKKHPIKLIILSFLLIAPASFKLLGFFIKIFATIILYIAEFVNALGYVALRGIFILFPFLNVRTDNTGV